MTEKSVSTAEVNLFSFLVLVIWNKPLKQECDKYSPQKTETEESTYNLEQKLANGIPKVQSNPLSFFKGKFYWNIVIFLHLDSI